MTKTRQDNDITDCTVRTTLKSELNYHDQSDMMQSITKIRYDNDVIYVEYDT